MKVAVLTNSFPPEGAGGAARIACLQVHMMREAGYEVRIWTPSAAWLERTALFRLVEHIRDLKSRTPLVKEMLAWKPDALLTHNLTGCGFGTPRNVRPFVSRWIHLLHDVQLFEPSGELKDARPFTLWQRVWSYLRRRAFGNPDIVISPTVWLLDEHKRRGFFSNGNTQARVLPNPGPITNIRDRAFLSQRERHTPIRLLFVGRWSLEKGRRIIEQMEKKLVAPHEMLKVVGNLDHETVLQNMKDADALLVPSQIEENQPTVILEAASVGLPVIASDKGGIPETLGEAGLIVKVDDIKSWCEAVELLTQDQTVYAAHVKKMEQLAREHEPAAYAQRFLSLLTSNT